MFTVLISYQSKLREFLITAKSVEYAKNGDHAGLLLGLPDGTSVHYGLAGDLEDARDVFVMNAAGKTVARYSL